MEKLNIQDAFDPEKIGTLHNKLTSDAGLIRLTEELRFKPAGNRPSADGLTMIWDEGYPAGFDCETSDYSTKLNWFADARVKKRSKSQISTVVRWMFVLHPTEFQRD